MSEANCHYMHSDCEPGVECPSCGYVEPTVQELRRALADVTNERDSLYRTVHEVQERLRAAEEALRKISEVYADKATHGFSYWNRDIVIPQIVEQALSVGEKEGRANG